MKKIKWPVYPKPMSTLAWLAIPLIVMLHSYINTQDTLSLVGFIGCSVTVTLAVRSYIAELLYKRKNKKPVDKSDAQR